MKRTMTLILSALIAAALLAGCGINVNTDEEPSPLPEGNTGAINNNPDGNVQGGDVAAPEYESVNYEAKYRHELNINPEQYAGQKLVMWTFWEPTGESETMEAFEEATGAKVEFVNKLYETYNEDLVKAIASGEGPDLCVFAEEAVPAYVMNGFLLPVSDYIDFSKVPWPVSQAIVNYYTFNGKLYAMPDAGTESSKLYFRRDIFANASVDNPYDLWKAGRWTWDEFIRVAKEIQQYNIGADGEYGVWGYYSYQSAQIFYSNGADYVKWVDGNPVEALSDPKAIRAMEWDRSLTEQHNIYKPWDADNDPVAWLVDGKVAMMYWGDWLLHGDDGFRAVLGDKLGIAPFPIGPDATSKFGDVASGHKEGIAGSSNNPELAALYLLFKRLPKDEEAEAEAQAEEEAERVRLYGSIEEYEMCVEMESHSTYYAPSGFTGLDSIISTIRGKTDMSPAQAVESYKAAAQTMIDRTWKP